MTLPTGKLNSQSFEIEEFEIPTALILPRSADRCRAGILHTYIPLYGDKPKMLICTQT